MTETRSHPPRRFTSPAALLGAGLLAAGALAALPSRWTEPLKSQAARAVRPAQVAASTLREECGRWSGSIKAHFQSSACLAAAENELAELRRENRRLGDEISAARMQASAPASTSSDDPAERLLRVRGVDAQVLGRQALAFLGQARLLDVGTCAGAVPNALVAAGALPAVIDRGRDAQLASGRLVLSGARVWGRIVEAGPCTSLVRTVTEPGYRDLVRLMSPAAGAAPARPGAQGLLEGTGQRLAQIRHVEVTEPVAVGDLVYTAAEQGLLPEPLLYGRIVRVERPVGAAHWELWMEPAVAADAPQRVTVLRTELNPLRVAAADAAEQLRGPADPAAHGARRGAADKGLNR